MSSPTGLRRRVCATASTRRRSISNAPPDGRYRRTMSCCRSGPCEQMFSPRVARRSLERYRSKGLDELERRIVASAEESGVQGARVLEIGGGIGTIQTELLEAGAALG